MTKIKVAIAFGVCSFFKLAAFGYQQSAQPQTPQSGTQVTSPAPADKYGRLDLGAQQSNGLSEEEKANREKEKENREKEEAKFKELTTNCENLHRELGLDDRNSKIACEIHRRVYQTQDPEILQCVQSIKSTPEIDSGLAFACFHQAELFDSFKVRKLKENLPQCLKLTSQQSAGFFWIYEEMNYISTVEKDMWRLKNSRNNWDFPKTRFEKFFHDCAKMDPTKEEYESAAKLVGVVNFHSRFSVPKKSAKDISSSNAWIAVGGLSGLALDSTGALVAVSDEKRTSYLHRFQRVLKPQGNYSLSYMDSKEIQLGKIGGSFDFEDLFIQPDGRIWLSTDIEFKKEESGTLDKIVKFFSFEKENKDAPENNDSFIVELDSTGKYLKHIATPDELIPTYGNVEYPCPNYPSYPSEYPNLEKKKKKKNTAENSAPILLTNSGISGQAVGDSQLQTAQQVESQQTPAQQTPPPPPVKCYNYKQVKGVKSNSAVEAFTVDPRRRLYWVSSEHPTVDQDEVRIFEMDMTTQKILKTLTYPMSKDRNNGLTSMMYYNDNVFLTVERAHSWGDKEARVNVFLTRMNSAGNSFDKTVLISNEMIKSKMAPGFTEVDNFEGLTVGPSANPGKKMIYLVSDSNFNVAQRSVFLMFEIPEELLR